MAKHPHGYKENVAFTGFIKRIQQIKNDDGSTTLKPYFRSTFKTKDGDFGSVNTADANLEGKAGTVMFVEKGQLNPMNQQPVAQDAWTLVSATSSATTATEAKAVLVALEA